MAVLGAVRITWWLQRLLRKLQGDLYKGDHFGHRKHSQVCFTAEHAMKMALLIALALNGAATPPEQPLALKARFYAEKHSYIVGEPIFLNLEVVNDGDQPVAVDSSLGAPCIAPDTIEVVGAVRKPTFSPWAPSCSAA